MSALKDIHVDIQKVFTVAIILKIVSAFIGMLIHDRWILVFAVPMIIMLSYIAIGIKRHPDDISDEKFGDSCYYLGFVFTIFSIILVLLDLKSIGNEFDKVAFRFGVAMLSTLLGIGTRVYIVNFKRDIQDVPQTIEESLMDATKTFQIHLELAADGYKQFHEKMQVYSNQVITQLELTKDKYSQDLTEVFKKFSDDANKTTELLSDNFETLLKRNSDSVIETMKNFETELIRIAITLDTKLQEMTLPGDYFVGILREPVAKLRDEIAKINGEIITLSGALKSSSNSVGEEVSNITAGLRSWSAKISIALGKIVKGFDDSSTLMEKIRFLTAEQQQILDILDTFTQTTSNISISAQDMNKSVGGFITYIDGQIKGIDDKLQTISNDLSVTAGFENIKIEHLKKMEIVSEQMLYFVKGLPKEIAEIQLLLKKNNELIEIKLDDIQEKGSIKTELIDSESVKTQSDQL